MTFSRFGFLALLSALAGCATPSGGPAQASAVPPLACDVQLAAEVAVDTSQGFVVAPGIVAGKPVPLMVDTGSTVSMLTPETVDRLGLRAPVRASPRLIRGAGGWLSARVVQVSAIGLGGASVQDVQTPVAPLAHSARVPVHAGGLIGTDVLAQFDVEFDLPRQRMRLYRVSGCNGAFIPWQGRYFSIGMQETSGRALSVPVRIDGQPVNALLDTGSRGSGISAAALDRLGLARGAAAGPPGAMHGVDGVAIPVRQEMFRSIEIGPEHFASRAVTVMNVRFGVADMLLGADYLRGRRVWLSYATDQMFVQPAGP